MMRTVLFLVPFLFLVGCTFQVDAPSTTPSAGGDLVQQMRNQPLGFTRHGSCRMACRNIDEAEVRAILMTDGVLKPDRSRNNGECPSHALEGRTRDGQQVRIVYAACANETRVVTVIDLDTDWPCGDC